MFQYINIITKKQERISNRKGNDLLVDG
jgi:hypothetical protein